MDKGNKVTGAFWDTEITYTDAGGKSFTSNIRVDTYQVGWERVPAPEVAKRRLEMGLEYADLAPGDKLLIAHSPSSPELVKLAQSLNIHLVSWFLAFLVAAAFAILVLRSKVVRPTKRDDAG